MDTSLLPDFKKFLSIEPLLIFWLLPSYILITSIDKIKLEKSCVESNSLNDTVYCKFILDRTQRNTVKCKHFYSAYTNNLNPINLFATRGEYFDEDNVETTSTTEKPDLGPILPPYSRFPDFPSSDAVIGAADSGGAGAGGGGGGGDKISELNGNAEIVLDWNNVTANNETTPGLKPYKINLNFNFKINSSQISTTVLMNCVGNPPVCDNQTVIVSNSTEAASTKDPWVDTDIFWTPDENGTHHTPSTTESPKSTSTQSPLTDDQATTSFDTGNPEVRGKICKAEKNAIDHIHDIEEKYYNITVFIKMVVILFAGVWMDKHRRVKPIILMSLIGELIGSFSILLTGEYEFIPLHVGFGMHKIIPALFGDKELMLVSMYYYLAAKTTEEERTFRYAFVPLFSTKLLSKGLDMGKEWTGQAYHSTGIKTLIFFMPLISFVVAIVYCIFVLKEIGVGEETVSGEEGDTILPPQPQPPTTKISYKLVVYEAFNWKSENSYQSFFKKPRPQNQKDIIKFLICAFFLMVCPIFLEFDGLLDFLQAKSLRSNYEDILWFNTFTTVIFGTTALTTILTKYAKMPDAIICILSLGLSIISKPLLAFCEVRAIDTVYKGYGIDCLSRARTVATRSLISKFVFPDEFGRTFATMTALDLMAGFSMPFVNKSFTLDDFPGMIFIISELFLVPTFIIYVLVYHRTMSEEENSELVKNGEFLQVVCCKAITDQQKTIDSIVQGIVVTAEFAGDTTDENGKDNGAFDGDAHEMTPINSHK